MPQPTLRLRLRLTAGLLSAALLSGCSQPVRQSDSASEEAWPELDGTVQECTAISGTYRAVPRPHGESTQADQPLLANTLLPATAALAEADRVALEANPERFTVTAFAGDTVLLSQTYLAESGIFECIDGSLEFQPAQKPGANEQAEPSGIPWETIRLRRTVSGSLLLQEADGLASFAFMLFPIYFTSEHWYQFEPIE